MNYNLLIGVVQAMKSMTNKKIDKKFSDKNVIRRRYVGRWFIIFFSSMLGGISLLGIFIYHRQLSYLEEEIILTEKLHQEFIPDLISANFTDTGKQALILSEYVSSQLNGERAGTDVWKNLERMFQSVAEISGKYDQIRFLDSSGQEKVRVNSTGTTVRIVPQEELQNKADRYYFRYALGLGKGQIFVSQLDLNVEDGEIEIPYKPVIRFSTPVFNPSGQCMGVVVMISLSSELYNYIQYELEQHQGHHMFLLNSRGYYLVNSEDAGREFGFMFAGKENLSLGNDNPDLWELIQKSSNGEAVIRHELYVFRKIRPLEETWISSRDEGFCCEEGAIVRDEYEWYLLSHIPADVVTTRLNGELLPFYQVYTALILLFLVLSFFLGRYKTSLELKKETIRHMAYHDELTGLKSRVFGLERLKINITRGNTLGERFALLYCDVNKFKPINDEYGHEAGDYVLREVAERLEKSVRPDDTVIRMGGDEFVLILEKIPNESETTLIACRIIENIEKAIPYRDYHFRIGISIGIVFFPEDGITVPDLLKKAIKPCMPQKRRDGGCSSTEICSRENLPFSMGDPKIVLWIKIQTDRVRWSIWPLRGRSLSVLLLQERFSTIFSAAFPCSEHPSPGESCQVRLHPFSGDFPDCCSFCMFSFRLPFVMWMKIKRWLS